MNVLKLQQAQEIDKMQFIYIKKAFRFLIEDFARGITNEYDSSVTLRFIFFLVFILFLCIIYLAIWKPLLHKLNRDVRTPLFNYTRRILIL